MKIDSNDEDSINKNQKNTEIPEEEETIFDFNGGSQTPKTGGANFINLTEEDSIYQLNL